MTSLNCIYLEHDKVDGPRFQGEIERAWKHLEPDIPISVELVKTPEEAIALLKAGGEKYQLLVADIYFPHGKTKIEQQLGLMAISQAREVNPSLAIIALSIGNHKVDNKAKEAGADAYVSKSDVLEEPQKRWLDQAIIGSLRKRGREPARVAIESLIYDDTDLRLVSLIESVGKINILNFASQLAEPKRIQRVKASYVASGLSGSLVVKVDCDVATGPGHPPDSRHYLLKISRDKEQLDAEAAKDISYFSEGLFVPFLLDRPVRSGRWNCIGANFKHGAKTLIDWLRDERVASKVPDVLSELFSERGLGKAYRGVGERHNERPSEILWSVLSTGRRARIEQAIKELSVLAAKYGPAGWFDEGCVSQFIKDPNRIGELCPKDKLCRGRVVWSHGDLHGRNILVDESNRGYLVDPANIGQLHWACDMARLLVDLIVSGWDAEPISYEWDAMGRWCDLVMAIMQNQSLPSAPTRGANLGVYLALRWMRSQMAAIHDSEKLGKQEWEFLIALAIEFLRTAYRWQDLPPPKRVLGLLAASKIITDVARIG